MNAWMPTSLMRAIFLSLLLVAIVPIVLISTLFIRESSRALTDSVETNLQSVAEAKAEEINLKLDAVTNSTQIAAHQAAVVLGQAPDPEQVAQEIGRYQRDDRDVLGLDVFYSEAGGEAVLGERLSNVYWKESALPPLVEQQIVQSAQLDPIFESIKSVSPETQWIYMTTPEGMMRLYPWASNDHYPDGWNPDEIIFYTIAAPENNPSLEPQWTPAYVDYAGAGWMVTLSVPIIDDDGTYYGIMSHDITIQSLKDIALSMNVLDGEGYGFLIDQQGNIIAHPGYDADTLDASEGTQGTINLLHEGEDGFQGLVQRMVQGEGGRGYYTDSEGEQHALIFAPIPSIGWSLGIVVPQTAVISPAVAMRSRTLFVSLALVVIVLLLAIWLAQRINRPLTQLLAGVNQLSEEGRKPDPLQVDSFEELHTLSLAFNNMADLVWRRENRLKKTVAELRVEIDNSRSQTQVEELTETEYFRFLERNAEHIRKYVRGDVSMVEEQV